MAPVPWSVNFKNELQVQLLKFGHEIADAVRGFLVGGGGVILEMRFTDRGDDVLRAEELRQMHIVSEVLFTGGIHQICMAAHSEGDEVVRLKQTLHFKQAGEGLIREDVLGPAFRGGQLDVMKARGTNARDGFLNGIAMVAVGVYSDDSFFHNYCSFHVFRGIAEPG